MHSLPHLRHNVGGDSLGVIGTLLQDLPDAVGVGSELGAALTEGSKVIGQVLGEELLALYTAYARGPAVDLNLIDIFGREEAVQGEDVAYLGAPRIGQELTLRVGDLSLIHI